MSYWTAFRINFSLKIFLLLNVYVIIFYGDIEGFKDMFLKQFFFFLLENMSLGVTKNQIMSPFTKYNICMH